MTVFSLSHYIDCYIIGSYISPELSYDVAEKRKSRELLNPDSKNFNVQDKKLQNSDFKFGLNP